MKRITGFSVLCLAATMFVGFARADDSAPTAPAPKLATDQYVELAYDSLDAKKQDKLSTGSYVSIETDETTNKQTIDLALPALNNSTDGTFVLTAKVVNGVTTLQWESIERTSAQ